MTAIPRERIELDTLEFVQEIEAHFGIEAVVNLGLGQLVDVELRLLSWLDIDAPLFVKRAVDGKLRFRHDREY